MKTTFFLATTLLLLSFSSCKKPQTYCGAKDPLTEVGWLKEAIESVDNHLWVYEETYNSQDGFYFYQCLDSNCHYPRYYYKRCDGELLYQAGVGQIPSSFPEDFDQNTTYKKLIYSK